jgi:hypothetical protein
VDTWFTAKRVFPSVPLLMLTRASSAVENDRTFWASASASDRER